MDDHQINAVLRAIAPLPDVVLVGGQSIVIWSHYYAHSPEFLEADIPVTTKDVDFLGSAKRAKEVAAAVNARIAVPLIDDATPSSAVLDLGCKGSAEERVDFVDYVKGPGDAVRREAISIEVQLPDDAPGTKTLVRVMHPLHCLQSKLENRISLGRSGLSAQTQLEATTPILREFVSDMLERRADARSLEARMAVATLDALGVYLRRHPTGRQADRFMERDPLSILHYFSDDGRIPAQFRDHNIANAIGRIVKMRAGRQAVRAKGPAEDEPTLPPVPDRSTKR